MVLVVETANVSDIGSYSFNLTGILPDGNAESVIFVLEIAKELPKPPINRYSPMFLESLKD